MRRFLCDFSTLPALLTGSLLLLAPEASGAPDIPGRTGAANAIGVVIGVPQTVAVTYWRTLTPRIQMSIHAGSAVLFSSAGARVQIGPGQSGLRPYAFAGYTVIHSTAEDYGDPEGLSGYLWLGPGVSLRARRWALFAEICALAGGDEDRGLGSGTWIFPFAPAVSGGLLFRF